MKKLLHFVLLGTCTLLAIAGCNALSAFETVSTDQDRVELGEQCLRDGDFDCAVAAYSGIVDSQLKAEKLCAARLSQAGFGISELVDTLISNSGSSQVLGRLATALIGWTTARQTAADAAVTQCSAFRTATATTDIKYRRAILLKALSSFVHCATLLAKTDVLRTEDGTNCTYKVTSTSAIVPDSVTDDATTGTVSTGHPGMCNADVIACVDDFVAISGDASDLSSQIPDIGTAFSNIPSDLKNSSTGADLGRLALRGVL